MTEKKKHFVSLSVKPLFVLLLGLVLGVCVCLLANFTGEQIIERSYMSDKAVLKRTNRAAQEFQSFVRQNSISTRDTDMLAALGLLNTLRIHRGLTEVKNLSKEELQQELEREYYREMIGEGQVFFYHKRMNTKMIATANAVYVLPMPDDEINLGQRQ